MRTSHISWVRGFRARFEPDLASVQAVTSFKCRISCWGSGLQITDIVHCGNLTGIRVMSATSIGIGQFRNQFFPIIHHKEDDL